MVSLTKNQTVSLTKTSSSKLSQIGIGLGWDPLKKKGFLSNLFGGNEEIDLDASCLLLDASGNPLDLVWFQQLTSQCGSISHSGDNRTGEGDGDDEVITVNLDRLPDVVEHLAITVNSFTGQNFNQVDNAFCRVFDAISKKELTHYKLTEQGSHTGILIASISRAGGEWNFKAHGLACNGRVIQEMLPQIIRAII